MTARALIRKSDAERIVAGAVAGAIAGGMTIGRVELDPSGKVVILSSAESPPVTVGRVNPLDRLLNR